MEDQETEEYEEFGPEEAEVQPQPKAKKVKKVVKTEEVPEERYVAYHQEKSSGIIDRETNEVVGTDTNTLLAALFNKVDSIERSTG